MSHLARWRGPQVTSGFSISAKHRPRHRFPDFLPPKFHLNAASGLIQRIDQRNGGLAGGQGRSQFLIIVVMV